jgi:hypothetical protein
MDSVGLSVWKSLKIKSSSGILKSSKKMIDLLRPHVEQDDIQGTHLKAPHFTLSILAGQGPCLLRKQSQASRGGNLEGTR